MLLFTCMHVCQGLVLSPKEFKFLNFKKNFFFLFSLEAKKISKKKRS